tara:strand:+ start:394 stop:1179 length:786 start_codon:yes stop_codon:yes gene_type:complete
MIRPTNKIHVAEFNEYLRELNKHIKGVSFEKIIKGEAASILGRASKLTTRAKPADIRAKYKAKSRKKKDLPERFQKRKREKGTGRFEKGPGIVKGSRLEQNPKLIAFIKVGGKKYRTRNYYPDPIWKKITTELKEQADERVDLSGSGKATWYLIAKKARLPTHKFEGKTLIRKAIAAQKAQSNTFADDKVENGTPIKKRLSFAIKVENNANCALNKSARGVYAIKSAMGGRQKFMQTNLKKGVFDTFKAEANAYPNIFLGE